MYVLEFIVKIFETVFSIFCERGTNMNSDIVLTL